MSEFLAAFLSTLIGAVFGYVMGWRAVNRRAAALLEEPDPGALRFDSRYTSPH